MSQFRVDTQAIAAAAGRLAALGDTVASATSSAEPRLLELSWPYPGAQFADAAGGFGRSMRQALDDLQVALETLANGMSQAASGYARAEEAATAAARGLLDDVPRAPTPREHVHE